MRVYNLIPLIFSGAMMLDHLGKGEVARLVRLGVEEFLRRGEGLTPDLGGTGTTAGTGGAIARLIRSYLGS